EQDVAVDGSVDPVAEGAVAAEDAQTGVRQHGGGLLVAERATVHGEGEPCPVPQQATPSRGRGGEHVPGRALPPPAGTGTVLNAAVAPSLLVRGEIDLDPGAQLLTAHGEAGGLERVLVAVVLQPGAQELPVRLDVLAVDLGADGAQAQAQRAIEGGAPPEER